jgi:hypothetical protein
LFCDDRLPLSSATSVTNVGHECWHHRRKRPCCQKVCPSIR